MSGGEGPGEPHGDGGPRHHLVAAVNRPPLAQPLVLGEGVAPPAHQVGREKRVFAAASITTTVREQYPRPQGRHR